MSSRLAAASNSLFVTTHGGSMPSAIRNKSVSRITSSPRTALPRVMIARGRCPQTPGYLTHDDAHGVLVLRGTAGDGMTAHGDDEVRRHKGCRTFLLRPRARRPSDPELPHAEANLPTRYPTHRKQRGGDLIPKFVHNNSVSAAEQILSKSGAL